MCKILNKYNEVFGDVDWTLLVLSPASGGVYIASVATVIGAPVRITTKRLGLASLGIAKKQMQHRQQT